MPSVASSPSTRAQSCSAWYLRSSGYDSAANSALLLVDGFGDDERSAVAAAHVDRKLGPDLRQGGRHVAHADSDLEHRRVRAGGHDTAAVDRHPLARDRLLAHHERDELPLRALRLDAAQLVRAGEVRVERARPPQACGDRVRLGRDVVPVQRVADLEAQRVARAEPARLRTARDDRVPQRDGILGGTHELDALLAGVAGAVDHHLDAVDLAHLPGERLALL